jgi:hypothetical protein
LPSSARQLVHRRVVTLAPTHSLTHSPNRHHVTNFACCAGRRVLIDSPPRSCHGSPRSTMSPSSSFSSSSRGGACPQLSACLLLRVNSRCRRQCLQAYSLSVRVRVCVRACVRACTEPHRQVTTHACAVWWRRFCPSQSLSSSVPIECGWWSGYVRYLALQSVFHPHSSKRIVSSTVHPVGAHLRVALLWAVRYTRVHTFTQAKMADREVLAVVVPRRLCKGSKAFCRF